MVNQWGRDGNFTSGGSRSAGAVIISAIVALIIGLGGGYAGARFISGVSQSDVEARDKRIAELQKTISDAKFDSKDSGAQQTVLRQRVKDLEGQVAALNRTKETLKTYADQQASKVSDDAKAEIAALQKTIEQAGDLSTQLNRAKKSQKVSELQIIELEGDVRDQKIEISRLQDLVDKQTGDSDAIAKLRDQIKLLQSALASAKSQLAAIPGLKQQIAALNDQLAKRADSADAEARQQIAALQKQNDSLQSQLDAAVKATGNTSSQATKKIADLQKQLDEMAESLADRDQAARNAGKDLQQAKADLSASAQQLKSLHNRNETLVAASDDLKKQVVSLTATIAKLKASTPPAKDTPVDDDNNQTNDTTNDNALTPRQRDDVEKAVGDLPGYDNLSADKQQTLVEMLEKGECVTDSLKAAYGHVSPISLRSLFRDLSGRC